MKSCTWANVFILKRIPYIVSFNAHVDHHRKHVKMLSVTLWIVSELWTHLESWEEHLKSSNFKLLLFMISHTSKTCREHTNKLLLIETNREGYALAVSAIPPVCHQLLSSYCVYGSFLECNVVNECEPAIRCLTVTSSCLEYTHFERCKIDIFDPGYRSIVYKAPSEIEVIDWCL